QVRYRQGQIDPVRTVDLQQLPPIEHIVGRHRIHPGHPRRHDHHPQISPTAVRMNPPAPAPPDQSPTSAVRGEASLVLWSVIAMLSHATRVGGAGRGSPTDHQPPVLTIVESEFETDTCFDVRQVRYLPNQVSAVTLVRLS